MTDNREPTRQDVVDAYEAGRLAGWDEATREAQAKFQRILDLGRELGSREGRQAAARAEREADERLAEAARAFIAETDPVHSMETRAARERAALRPVDTRSPEQLVADAAASWGITLDPPAQRESAASTTRHRVTARVDDDAADLCLGT